jgi:hypothetical protein
LAGSALNANFIYRALDIQFRPRGVFVFILCSAYKPHNDKTNLEHETDKKMNNRSCKLHGSNMYYPWVIIGNNHTKRFKLDVPSKIYSAKSLEGTSLCNACSQKWK